LFNLDLGNGTIISGNFSNIDWANDSFFLKIEMDPGGGSNYQLMGTSQLLSVPYALHSSSGQDYSIGIDNDDNDNFKISGASQLQGNIYSDPNTLLRFHSENPQNGIMDVNHQSRGRAFLTVLFPFPGGWFPIPFDAISYDEHGEYIPSQTSRF